MIDIHCHILPDFDDGSRCLEESLDMARMALDSGVTDVVCTSHFRGNQEGLDRIGLLLERYRTLERALKEQRLPLHLHLGSEILLLPQTPRLAARQQLPTYGNTSYCLVEFYFDAPPAYMTASLEALTTFGYHPVVAHPERYDAVQANPRLLESWFRAGDVLHSNKGSVLGGFGPEVQRTVRQLLDMGLIHAIASDAHGSTHRTPDMNELELTLREEWGSAYTNILLNENPRRVLLGQRMAPIR